MENGAITMKIGDSVRISMTEVLGTNEKFSITYPELINDVNVGSHILLDDGLIDLEVTDIDRDANEIVTVVKNEGVLKNKKGVNVPGVSVNLPGSLKKMLTISVSELVKELTLSQLASFVVLLTF